MSNLKRAITEIRSHIDPLASLMLMLLATVWFAPSNDFTFNPPHGRIWKAIVIGAYLLLVVDLAFLLWVGYLARKKRNWDRGTVVAVLFFLPFVITPWLLAATSLALRALAWLQTPNATSALKVPSVVVATTVCTLLLFAFRWKFRMVYGVTETLFALIVSYRLAVATDAQIPLEDPAFLFGFLSASVYVGVRGLDNIHQGLVKEPIDALWAWLQRSPLKRQSAETIMDRSA